MDDAEMASLVEALTPRVVEACRNQLSNNDQSSVATSSTSRQFDSNRPSTSGTGRASTSRQLILQPSTMRLSATRPSTSGHGSSNVQRKKVVKGKTRADIHRDGLLIDKFKFEKSWTENQLFDALHNAFSDKLTADNGEPITFCIKKAEGVDLLQPRIRPDECLDGAKICEIFVNKTIYLCPDREIKTPSETVISSDESDYSEGNKDDLKDDLPEMPSEPTVGATCGNKVELGTNDGFTCPRCTFINPASAVECEMCFDTMDEERENAVPETTRSPPRMDSADPVKTIRELTGFDNNPAQILYVSRDRLFEDNIAFFKSKFKCNQPISVRFFGEKAVDAGGPLRENFRILTRKLHAAELNMFYGTHSHNLLPSNNQMLMYSGMYEVLGKIISACIINGVPMRLPLHPAVIDCVLDRPRDEQFAKITIDDILDVDLKEFLTKILNCEGDDGMSTVINDEANPTHWLDNCGWPVSQQMTVSCKHEIVMCVMYHYIIGIRSAAITAIQTGMKCNDQFPWKVITPSYLSKLLAPPLINATELKRLVQPSIDKLRADASEHATYITSLIDKISDTEANMMAVFATAADCMYEDLTEIKLQLNTFNRLETSPIGNTCSASILFPVSFSSCSAFKTHVLARMKEAVDFFGML